MSVKNRLGEISIESESEKVIVEPISAQIDTKKEDNSDDESSELSSLITNGSTEEEEETNHAKDYLTAMEKHDYVNAKESLTKYFKDKHSRSYTNEDEARFIYSKIEYFNDLSAISEILELYNTTDSHKDEIAVYVAKVFNSAREYKKSIEFCGANYENVKKDSILSNLLTQSRISSEKLNDTKETEAMLLKSITKVTNSTSKAKVYHNLAQLYKITEDWLPRILCLERAVNLDQTLENIRFDAAYAESDNDIHEVSIINYQFMIANTESKAGAHNNLAIAYENLDMNHYGVINYRKASELGHTLAQANLANLYMNEGFIEEARQLIVMARYENNVHSNIEHASKRIEDIMESESEKEKETIVKGHAIQQFLREYAEYFYESTSNDCGGTYVYKDNDLVVNSGVNEVNIEYDKVSPKYKIVGVKKGRTLELDISTESISLLRVEGSSVRYGDPVKHLAYINPSDNNLRLLNLSTRELMTLVNKVD